jgi:hypothetical protein
MIEEYLAKWVDEAPALIGSVIAVLFMVGVAALLGFRTTTHLNEAELKRLAAAEGMSVDRFVIAENAKLALARLGGGKLMIARVMGADVSARVMSPKAAHFRFRNGKFSVAFADTGFPPLDLEIDQTPPWLAQLAGGEAS